MEKTNPGVSESKKVGEKQSEIRSFQADIPESQIAEMRRRISATIWPERETVQDSSQGVQLKTIQALAKYWANEYDWRKAEERLNSYPQFITEIDGLDIHFVHVRSKHENALPLIVTHGWPGSIFEQLKIIDPLVNPTAHGGSENDAFHIVIPSLPGYGFSAKPETNGWDPVRIARAWTELMNKLGYSKFVAQGGDWGAAVTEQMGVLAPKGLLGIHTNMPSAVPAEVFQAIQGGPAPTNLSSDEQRAFEQVKYFFTKGVGYAIEMANRPQTMYALADSPVGLAAWMIDHDIKSYEMIARVFDGKTEGLTKDDILDNITVCWLTNTAVSSARMYWQNKAPFFVPFGVKIPVAVSAFPDELYQAPKSWVEKVYPNLIHYNRLEKGGHFAAWEQPKLLSDEIRTGFRKLRTELQ